MTDYRFRNRRRAFTLIELLVVVSIIALLVAILLPSLSKAREQARWAKCLGNLHAISVAIVTYTTDYNGTMPGPLHPAVLRNIHDFGDLAQDHSGLTNLDKQKSLIWLLRPYFSSGGGFAQESKVADEVSKCPTAIMITPDEEWYADQQILDRPYNYAINSWGPQFPTVGQPDTSDQRWFHTDPPLYFGVWYYLDTQFEEARFRGGMWKPKKIESIKFASAEYSVADAWYRRVAQATRRGTTPKREYLGTFPSQNSGSPLPSAPYHLTDLAPVRSTRNQPTGQGILPKINFKGKTNLAYLDGHATGFRGRWQERGEGGTVNPFWVKYGGTHE